MKSRRQRAILSLIESRPLHTHAELASALAGRGIAASQGTLSRDLRQLGIVKTADGYAGAARPRGEDAAKAALRRLAGQFLVGVETAQNLVILRTEPGGANALAQGLDTARLPEIMGTVAGDDTIFVATRDGDSAARVRTLLDGELLT